MNTDTGDYSVTSPDIVPQECRALAFSGIHILSDKVLALMEEYVKEKGLPVDEVKGTRFPIMSFYMWVTNIEICDIILYSGRGVLFLLDV